MIAVTSGFSHYPPARVLTQISADSMCVCVCACCFNTDSERILLKVLWHLSTSLDEELEGPEGDGVVRSFRIRLGYIQQQLQQQPGSY